MAKKWKDRFATYCTRAATRVWKFECQKMTIQQIDEARYRSWKVDKTGLGMNWPRNCITASPRAFEGVWFSAKRKSKCALNLLQSWAEERRSVANDPDVPAAMHSIQKITSGHVDSSMTPSGNDARGHGGLVLGRGTRSCGRAKARRWWRWVGGRSAVIEAAKPLQLRLLEKLREKSRTGKGNVAVQKRAILAQSRRGRTVRTGRCQSCRAKNPNARPCMTADSHDNQAKRQEPLSWSGGRIPAKSVKQPARTGRPNACARGPPPRRRRIWRRRALASRPGR